MPDCSLTIQHAEGLHARPANLFVHTAQKFRCDIQVIYGTRTVNAKSILSVLTLGANQGAQITLRAEGEDAPDALAALTHLVNDNFPDSAPE